EQEIDRDLDLGKHQSIHTRFPPEPNGYLHIGHAKSICLNFGIAEKYNGKCNLRFDDTNPEKENIDYVNSIKEDVKWMGFTWDNKEHYASDYFDKLYEYACTLIKMGLAYVDDQSSEEVASGKGTPTVPGKSSPFRDRGVEENLKLFNEMKQGVHPDGSRVLRAKIDMSSPNMHMRDPLIYRIKKIEHHRTGNKWNIYPMYDFAHGLSDSIEGITHSLCTLEFEVHRPLYDWFLEKLNVFRSRQIEFARLNLNYTVLSKRKLLQLVEGGFVEGWDDPRMPTISGLRRRGYTAESIRNFATKIGVAKRDNVIDVALLEHSIREDLNKIAERRFAVLDPVKLIIINYPENEEEWLDAVNNPEDESAGSRSIPFSREIWIDRSDFMVDPPKKFFRLSPGNEVRLKYAYIIRCTDFSTNESGEINEIYAEYDVETKSGSGAESSRKVKGTLGWVSAKHSVTTEVRLYDRLFKTEDVGVSKDFINDLNPESLKIISNAECEPSVLEIKEQQQVQFERIGYFVKDRNSIEGKLILNRTVTLRDTWGKIKG
ncbi:MAG: glutamine--tRNA ligase/YqeY domain fusion protein, partial [Cyclobacteriaceae bacterium]|nr:glutamine--tRNA ligase/YqeY domain fusion protein [Cyclobacteriaceae bacterium]